MEIGGNVLKCLERLENPSKVCVKSPKSVAAMALLLTVASVLELEGAADRRSS